MNLVNETRVAVAVLPVADFKDHLCMGTGFSDTALLDTVLEGYLRAAIAAVEARTGKIVLARDFTWSLEGWPDTRCLSLPVAPFRALISLTSRAPDGAGTLYNPILFRTVEDTHRPEIRPRGLAFPSLPTDNLVEVKFRAGFGEAWDEVPSDLAQAVLLLAAHYYEFRHETALGEGCMPFGVTSLLQGYKPLRVGFGGAA